MEETQHVLALHLHAVAVAAAEDGGCIAAAYADTAAAVGRATASMKHQGTWAVEMRNTILDCVPVRLADLLL